MTGSLILFKSCRPIVDWVLVVLYFVFNVGGITAMGHLRWCLARKLHMVQKGNEIENFASISCGTWEVKQ